MRFSDLLTMSVNNLLRRRLRTFLTVLGVVIGTASIVVMVSIGIGLKEFTIKQYSSYGSLTAIKVYNYDNGSSSDKKNPEDSFMTDKTMKEFENLPHVTSAYPDLTFNVVMRQGVYEATVQMHGIPLYAMENIDLKEGKIPTADTQDMEMVVGNMIIEDFSNAKTGKGYWDTGELADVDFMNKPVYTIFDTDAYYQSKGTSGGASSGGDSSQKVSAPKKYMLKTSGLVAGTIDEWNDYSYGVYVDLDKLEAQLKQVFKKKAIPGQPTNKKGKPYNYFVYDNATVNVDDMNNVVEVQKAISSMGYQASSQMEWLEQSKQQSNMIQAALGGIGAVSLLVAAIGIANTMMMSIYERTKEIGVLKVLGCSLKTIRDMFLLEAGFIGFVGGIIGLVLSFLVSFLVNKFLAATFLYGMDGKLSVIPIWLAVPSVGFAVIIGMAAGFFPAMRAMKLSPLAAIRND